MIQKRAFSLIEVLLVMGIIAVVTAMGFSITKRGAERAYNLYWYTGYSALYDGTSDAWLKEIIGPSNYPLTNYAAHICKLVRAEDNQCNTTVLSQHSNTFTAPNGITFAMEQSSNNNYFKITMTIPKPKTLRSFPDKTVIVYNYSIGAPEQGGYVYPAAVTGNGMLNLQTRADLLPFYIKTNDNTSTVIKNFYSFREAYCHVNDNSSYSGDSNTSISCNPSVDTNTSPHNLEVGGLIFPINPRKAF